MSYCEDCGQVYIESHLCPPRIVERISAIEQRLSRQEGAFAAGCKRLDGRMDDIAGWQDGILARLAKLEAQGCYPHPKVDCGSTNKPVEAAVRDAATPLSWKRDTCTCNHERRDHENIDGLGACERAGCECDGYIEVVDRSCARQESVPTGAAFADTETPGQSGATATNRSADRCPAKYDGIQCVCKAGHSGEHEAHDDECGFSWKSTHPQVRTNCSTERPERCPVCCGCGADCDDSSKDCYECHGSGSVLAKAGAAPNSAQLAAVSPGANSGAAPAPGEWHDCTACGARHRTAELAPPPDPPDDAEEFASRIRFCDANCYAEPLIRARDARVRAEALEDMAKEFERFALESEDRCAGYIWTGERAAKQCRALKEQKP